MKRALILALILLSCSVRPLQSYADVFSIKLKNGNTIKTHSYSEDNGKLYYEKYGTRIGIDKADIVEITADKDDQAAQGAAAAVEYMGYEVPSKYFMASGFPEKYYSPKCNGLYEQHADIKNYRTYIHVSGEYYLFSYLEKEGKPGWFVGQLSNHGRSIFYSKPEAPAGSTPDGSGQWLAGAQKGSSPLPEVKIVAVPPPHTAYEGVHAYVAEGFPFAETNGVYKPHRVYLGRILYRHTNNQFELYYQSKLGWVICNHSRDAVAYLSGSGLTMSSFPEQVKLWYDIHHRETNGRIQKRKN